MCLHHPDFAKLKENMLTCCFYPFDWFCHPREREKNIHQRTCGCSDEKCCVFSLQWLHCGHNQVVWDCNQSSHHWERTLLWDMQVVSQHWWASLHWFTLLALTFCEAHDILLWKDLFVLFNHGEEHKNTAINEETIVNWYISLVFLFICMCLSKIHVFVLFY